MPCFPFQGSAVKEPTRHQPSPPQLPAAGSSFPSQSTKTHRTSRTRGSGRPAGRNRLSQLHRVASYAHCRSEEHTSELQSPCNLVCRLLLEKKTLGCCVYFPAARQRMIVLATTSE